MRICLDTNAYSALGRNHPGVVALVEEAEEIIVPATVIGELMFGFLRGGRLSQNEADLNRFLHEEGVRVQPVTRDVAERYGYVRVALAVQGTPIPENDIWIAAVALETGSRILSYDTHFDHVGGLVRIAP